jgi:hypothetical protein
MTRDPAQNPTGLPDPRPERQKLENIEREWREAIRRALQKGKPLAAKKGAKKKGRQK